MGSALALDVPRLRPQKADMILMHPFQEKATPSFSLSPSLSISVSLPDLLDSSGSQLLLHVRPPLLHLGNKLLLVIVAAHDDKTAVMIPGSSTSLYE